MTTMRRRCRTRGYQSGRNSTSRMGFLFYEGLGFRVWGLGRGARPQTPDSRPFRPFIPALGSLIDVDNFGGDRGRDRRIARLAVARRELALGHLQRQPERG